MEVSCSGEYPAFSTALTAAILSLPESGGSRVKFATASWKIRFMHYDLGEWIHVGHHEDEGADQCSQCQRVQEDITQNVALMSVPLGGGGGRHDALHVDHLAPDSTRAAVERQYYISACLTS